MAGPDLSRRRFLTGAATAAGTTAALPLLAGCAAAGGPASAGEPEPELPHVELPAPVAGLPARQHAWQATLTTDVHGNAIAPRWDRLLFFDVRGRPTPAHARVLEAGLRRLETDHPWGPHGLLITAAWSHAYYADVLGTASPVPPPSALSDFENPTLDAYHLCLHLACDDAARLDAAQASLLDGPHAITPALRWRETRTGFTGAGLPSAHQDAGGIPGGRPVPPTSPLYMGFASGLRGNQATEDAVTVPSGPLAGGTTMAVSYMTLSLDSWYGNLTEAQRVARMYSPQTTVADQRRITDEATSNPDRIDQAIDRYGVIGHSQAAARARRHGKPIILRRDFDTADGGQAGLHFVSLQRSIADFVATRRQMNQSAAQLRNPAISNTTNNGINEFIFVLRRANYAMPPRAERAFPGVPGRDGALT